MANRQAWKVSLHGGHSGEFCEHAAPGTLREMLEAAVAAGYDTFGVSEHAARRDPRFLFPAEIEKGYTIERIQAEFDAYADEVGRLAEEFADRLTVLRGFEIEVIPANGYREEMLELRERYGFEYIVGSVHFVREINIDGVQEDFDRALEDCGDLETMSVEYYETVAEMVEALRPEVVGHLDLLRKLSPKDAALDTPRIRQAAERALEAVREHRGILDLNLAGYRKGLGSPYPAPWLIERARRMGVPFCFGDDSHSPADVGAGLAEGRAYLLENGVRTITALARQDGEIVRRVIDLGSLGCGTIEACR